MSLFSFQQLNQQIKDKLFEIAYKVSCFNKSGDNDISKYAEAYFRLLFNVIYKNKKWSFEKAVKINQDTYDLYDQKNKVCIQITSNSRNSKKSETIKSFEAVHFGKGYDTLIILFISDSKPKPDKLNRKFHYEDYNINEFSNLIEGNCNQKQLFEIRDILNERFDFTSDCKVNKAPNNKRCHQENF